jgi:hypothetical protein
LETLKEMESLGQYLSNKTKNKKKNEIKTNKKNKTKKSKKQ